MTERDAVGGVVDEKSSSDSAQDLPATSDPAAVGDAYVQSIDDVATAAIKAQRAIGRSVAALLDSRRDRLDGQQVSVVVGHLFMHGGEELRAACTEALSNYGRAVTAHRAAAVQILVDDERMTFTAVAEIFGVSRQMVARLYRTATSGERDGSHG